VTRRSLGRLAAWIAVGLVDASLAACAAAAPAPSAPSPLLGRPLPEMRRPALDGSLVDAARLRGSIVVVKFFADYCEPCTRTLPLAEELSRAYDDVVVIGVAEDEQASTVEAMKARFGITFPLVHDRSNELAARFRVTQMPVAFVADRAGIVRWVAGEGHADEDLTRAVEALR
jgi:peroxiredoxin